MFHDIITHCSLCAFHVFFRVLIIPCAMHFRDRHPMDHDTEADRDETMGNSISFIGL